jgi:hypothetical protein
MIKNHDNPNLILCRDHSYAPWHIVCVHLLNGESRRWKAGPKGVKDGEVKLDWLCPRCFADFPDVSVDDLAAVCMLCARELRGKARRRKKGGCVMTYTHRLEALECRTVPANRAPPLLREPGKSSGTPPNRAGLFPQFSKFVFERHAFSYHRHVLFPLG